MTDSSATLRLNCLRNCHFEQSEKSAFPASRTPNTGLTKADSSSHTLLGMTKAKGRVALLTLFLLFSCAAGTTITVSRALGCGISSRSLLITVPALRELTQQETKKVDGQRRSRKISKVSISKIEAANPSVINHSLRQILSQPEYNRVYPKETTPKWLKRFMKRVGDVVGEFFKWLFGSLALHGEQAGRLTSFVFACLVVMAFIALLALIISRISRRIRISVDKSSELAVGNYDIPSSRPLISEATKLADAGDWRGAFRCVYLASISHLDETGALRFEKSRTNWEYLRELDKNGRPALRDKLRPLTTDFDRKFYGRERCDRNDYLNALAVYERIKGEAAA